MIRALPHFLGHYDWSKMKRLADTRNPAETSGSKLLSLFPCQSEGTIGSSCAIRCSGELVMKPSLGEAVPKRKMEQSKLQRHL